MKVSYPCYPSRVRDPRRVDRSFNPCSPPSFHEVAVISECTTVERKCIAISEWCPCVMWEWVIELDQKGGDRLPQLDLFSSTLCKILNWDGTSIRDGSIYRCHGNRFPYTATSPQSLSFPQTRLAMEPPRWTHSHCTSWA